MKFKIALAETSGGCFIPISADRAEKILSKMGKRVICKVNDYSFHCAILRNDRRGHFIMISKTTLKNIKAEIGDEVSVNILRDKTEYQSPMPEELKAVLDTDPEALMIFENLSPGKKRSIMHSVNSAKQIDTRINRALKIVNNLKLGMTKPQDFLK